MITKSGVKPSHFRASRSNGGSAQTRKKCIEKNYVFISLNHFVSTKQSKREVGTPSDSMFSLLNMGIEK